MGSSNGSDRTQGPVFDPVLQAHRYETALQAAKLDPGDVAHLTCPTCLIPFFLELPALDSDVASSTVWGHEEMRITCANHCLPLEPLAGFQPSRAVVSTSGWIEYSHCTRYWTDTPSARCPVCGIENYRQVLQRGVSKVQSLDGGADQDAVIAATKDLVSNFEGVMRAMIRGHKANLAVILLDPQSTANIESIFPSSCVGLAERASRWPDDIRFQNLSGSRKNFLEATCICLHWHRGNNVGSCTTGVDLEKLITDELGAHAWSDTIRVFQKRHVHMHGLGAADAAYIANSGDHSFRVGQTVTIKVDELKLAARACMFVSNRFFAGYLS